MRTLLPLMLKEELRMHATYSSKFLFLAFPVMTMLFALGIALTSETIFETTPIAQLILFFHLAVYLYGLSVGAFGFLGQQYLERRYGVRNYLIAMPFLHPLGFRKAFFGMYLRDVIFYVVLLLVPATAGLFLSIPWTHFSPLSVSYLFFAGLLSFLLGVSTSFFISTLYVRSRWVFAIAVGILSTLFAAYALFQAIPLGILLPSLDLHYALPPFQSVTAILWGPLALTGLLIFSQVVLALILVRQTFEMAQAKVEENYPAMHRRVLSVGSLAALLAKELVDLRRSGTVAKMFFSFVTPLIFLSMTVWFVQNGLAVPVGFNTVFYAAMVGFFGIMLYNWLTNVDAMDYYSTLPVTVPQVIRAKLLAFFFLTTGISLAFVLGIGYLNGDLRLLWIAIPVLFITSLYMVVMTAYLTGLQTSSFLFNPGVLVRFNLLAMLPDIWLTILSFTLDRFWVYSLFGIALVLLSLGVTTWILYRGIETKWGRHDFLA